MLGVLIVCAGKYSDRCSLLLYVPFTPDTTFEKVSEHDATEVGTVVFATP